MDDTGAEGGASSTEGLVSPSGYPGAVAAGVGGYTGENVYVPRPRKKGMTVCCPVVYGSMAWWLGKKADDQHTHRWTLFVQGPNGEDISYFVSKVVFHLHPSFPEPLREITSYPFEVTEMGWGEFGAKMTLHFRDPGEAPVDVAHNLRLYGDPSVPLTTKQPVVAEQYDEVVFTDPSADFFDCLTRGHDAVPLAAPERQPFHARFSDADDVRRLVAARRYVHDQLRDVKDRISRIDAQMAIYSRQVAGGGGGISASGSGGSSSGRRGI